MNICDIETGICEQLRPAMYDPQSGSLKLHAGELLFRAFENLFGLVAERQAPSEGSSHDSITDKGR